MPRQKSYDRDAAVLRARDEFWASGYSMSVREIEERVGINRFALHTDFNGKNGIFEEALLLHAEDLFTTAIEPMTGGSIGEIRAFFTSAVCGDDPGDQQRWGCLMVNTSLEITGRDLPELQAITERHWQRLAAAFHSALTRAKDLGEIDQTLDIDAATSFLVTFAVGANVANRCAADATSANQPVEFLFDIIDAWTAATA